MPSYALAVAMVFPSGANATEMTPPSCHSKGSLSCPVVTSHSRTVLSPTALAIVFPSGENAKEKIKLKWYSEILSRPVSVSHSRTVPSELALERVVPSGENIIELTSSVCPTRVFLSCPESISHSRTVLDSSL